MVVLWLIAPLVIGVAGAINRRHVLRTIGREYLDRFPRDANGIAVGANGFMLAGTNGRGLLLLHGSGDSPQSLRYLGERLNAAGYTVHAPLLPGHGRSPSAFATATASDYHEETRRALEVLRASHQWVGIVGLSMGGALAARAAFEAREVRVLVLLAPYLIAPREVRWARATSWLWSWPVPFLMGRGDFSVHDAVARDASRAYGSFSAGALDALVVAAATGFQSLSKLTIPILVINSEQDNRIPRALAEEALEAIHTRAERHWVTGCGHVITVDYCKATVAELVVAFLARHAD